MAVSIVFPRYVALSMATSMTPNFAARLPAEPPDRNPAIAVIILNWNGKNDTLACLRSVRDISYTNFSTMVVDNGSTDGSVEAIADDHPAVTIIETGSNLGYAGGNNVGLKSALRAGAKYALLLNNDTVVDPQILSAFLNSAIAFPNGAMFAAKIYYFSRPTTIWYAGARWSAKKQDFEHVGVNEIDNGKFDAAAETAYACGCALFVRTDVINEIGFLHERYFLLYEEADWCYRAKRAGYISVFVPSAKVWHKVSASLGTGSPLIRYFEIRNTLLWAERNLPILACVRLNIFVISAFATELFTKLRRTRVSWSGGTLSPRRLYWTLIAFRREISKTVSDPIFLARMWGIRDYFFRRFGDCPQTLRLRFLRRR